MFRRFSTLLTLALVVLAACAAPAPTDNAPAPAASAVAAPAVAPAATTAAEASPAAATTEPTATTAAEAPTDTATAASAAAPTTAGPSTVPSPEATSASAEASASAPTTSSGPLRLVIVPQGTEARYRAREVLAGRTLPSDAIGRTNAVTGQIVIQPDGTLVPGQSKITVDVSTLQSDSGMRDGFIKRSTLQVDQYPTAEFVPSSVEGLPSPLPTSGDVNFTLKGDMTAHGVTHPMTWQVTGKVSGNEMTGTATSSFTFADFGMNKPQVPRVLSLEDTIKLELDFHVAKA